MSDAYADLARPLNAACPSGYERAWIEAQVGDDWDEQTAWCEGPEGKVQPKLSPTDSFNIGRTLRRIRSDMQQDGQQPWSRCTFTIFSDGRFKLDVDYGD